MEWSSHATQENSGRTHAESAHTKYKVHKGVLRQMKTIVLVRVWVILYALETQSQETKVMFNPPSLSVSSYKMNFISSWLQPISGIELSVPRIGGKDVEIAKYNLSGAGVA